MQTVIAAFFIFVLFIAVSAQNKMTDREFDGFKGIVKSVSIETMPISGSGDVRHKNKRVIWEKWSYDIDGRKTEEFNPQAKSKMIFSVKGGIKTSRLLEEEGGSSESFNFKYLYEYDSQGRVKTERIFLNNNKTPTEKTFKYDEKGRIIEQTDNEPASLTRMIFKYNEKGNLIEKLEDQKAKGEYGTDSKSRTVYSDYKVDAQGNWTERKSTSYYEGVGENIGAPYISMDYQVFIYYK